MTESLLLPIRELINRQQFVGVSDRELLQRFTHSRDEDAFTELVRRHSSVVWRVCQSILPRPDAEDAFQATFVVLARKANQLHGQALAGWLFRVGYRISLRVWKKRQRHALAPLSVDLPAPDDGLIGWRELQGVLHTELSRMPEKYRETLLLCTIEGCTKAEAAGRLAIPEGTVSSRLATAREMLRERLTRRGIELPMVLTALALGSTVSAKTIHRTAEIALQIKPTPVVITQMIDQTFGSFIGLKTTCVSVLMVVMLVGDSLGLGQQTKPPKDDPKPMLVQDSKRLVSDEKQPDPRVDEDGDFLPPEVLMRFGTARFRKGDGFHVTAVSQNGKLLASMGSAGIYVWDLQSGKIIQQYPPMWHKSHDKGRLCFIDGDRRLVVCSKWQSSNTITIEPHIREGEIARIWDIQAGKLVTTLILKDDQYTGGPGGIWSLDDGKKFISISITQRVNESFQTQMILWDAQTFTELERHTSDVAMSDAMDYSPTKDCFACLRYADPKQIRQGHDRGDVAMILDRKSGKEHWTSEKEDWNQAKFGFSPDGSQLAISRQKKLQLVTLATKKIESLKASPPQWGSHPAFMPDGKSILYTENYSLIQIEAKPDAIGQKRATVSTGFYFHLLPSATEIVGADHNDLLRQFDVTTGKETPREVSYRQATKVACQRRGPLVAVTDSFGKLDLWDTDTRKLVRSLRPGRPSYGQPAFDLKFSPDDRILASATTAGVIDLWSVADGKLLHSILIGKDKEKLDGADYVQFSNDGKLLYFLPRASPIACIEVQTGKWVDPGPVWSQFGRIVPNSNHVLMPEGKLIDLVTGKDVLKHNLPTRFPWELLRGDISLDGKRFAGVKVGEKGYHACVWDLSTGKELMASEPLRGHGGTVVRLHPDGKWLTVFDVNGTLQVWEVATRQAVYDIHQLNYHIWQTMQLGPRGRSALPANDVSPMLYSLRPLDTPKQFTASLWDQLGDKPIVAYRAQWAMLDHPAKAIVLLKDKLPPETAKRERSWFDGLILKLDSPTFKTREATDKQLHDKIAEIPSEWIRETIQKTTSDEVRNRLTKLLEIQTQTNEVIRTRLDRAVQVVEMIDTPAAHELLEAWSKGVGISNLKEAATQARGRLGLGKDTARESK